VTDAKSAPAQDIPRVGSLVDLMQWRAEVHGSRRQFVFLKDGEVETEALTYGEVDRKARALAVGLMERARPGERVLLLYPSSLEYPVAFLACLYAGLVAVPAYPPDPSRPKLTLPRINRIVNDARPRVILSTRGLAETAELARSQTCGPDEILCLSSDKAQDAWADDWRRPDGLERGLAFLQYTSGSTKAPRGVMVSHQNLIDHQRHAHGVFQGPDAATTVSWLPFYHDMGLIGAMLYPLYIGGRCVLMPPASFVRRPRRWLEAITRYGADTSAGPNFAYDLCVSRAGDEDVSDLDLSAWRLTVCGAEPLRADTLERFVTAFGPAGFRKSTFFPCHGMAEATLMVTGGRWGREPPIAWLDDAALSRRRAQPVPIGSSEGRPHVACGRPASGHAVRIVDPATRRALEPGDVGEIWARGPSIARGYWGLEQASASGFAARIEGAADDAGWLRTEDVGVVHGGELYVLGRLADLVRVAGRWLYPHLIEDELRTLPGVDGEVVFTSVAGADEDRRVVFVETKRRREGAEHAELARAIAERVTQRWSLTLDQVYCVPPRSVPKTTSGKLRRYAWRQAHAAAQLDVLWSWPSHIGDVSTSLSAE